MIFSGISEAFERWKRREIKQNVGKNSNLDLFLWFSLSEGITSCHELWHMVNASKTLKRL